MPHINLSFWKGEREGKDKRKKKRKEKEKEKKILNKIT